MINVLTTSTLAVMGLATDNGCFVLTVVKTESRTLFMALDHKVEMTPQLL